MKNKFAPIILILLLTGLSACSLFGSKDNSELGDGCQFGGPPDQLGESFDCDTFTVPVNYDEPEGATIDLTYIVMKATGDNPQPDPIVFLAGGPGQSAVITAQGFPELLQYHDMVFLAQRGTLFSSRLSVEECVELLEADERTQLVDAVGAQNELQSREDAFTYEGYFDAYSPIIGLINDTCYQAFAGAGLDPTQFNTLNSARDVVGLVQELGYESFNLFGVSYGTRLALEIARNFPDSGIRTMVLDSVATPSGDRLVKLVRAHNDAVLRLFADCASDEACNAAYPDLLPRTVALIESLEANPLEIEGDSVTVTRFVQQLSDLSNSRANYIPRMIAELEAGETATYVALRDEAVGLERPESASGSRNWDALVSIISLEVAEGDMMSGLAKIADLLGVMTEAPNADASRQAMITFVQSEFAESANLPAMIDVINDMTNEEITRIVEIGSATPAEVPDETVQQQRLNALKRNTAQFFLSGITCYEEIPFSSVDEALAEYNRLEIPQLGTSQTLLAIEVANCTNYPMPEPPAFYNAPVDSEIPTLILQGEFDVRTPLSYAETLAEELSNETLIVVPEQGHETSSSICVKSLIRNFLADPATSLDTTCIDERSEQFVMPDEALSDNE